LIPKSKVQNLDPLDTNFLAGIFDHENILKNMKKLEGIYAAGIKGELDERYFMNENQKLKTPLKMLQSPFGARAGPMQRNN
jgi:hypothetical protein